MIIGLLFTFAFSVWFVWKYVGVNFSLTSVLLMVLLILFGPAYLYYTRVWGPETEFFYTILLSAKSEVLETMDGAIMLTFIGVCLGVKLSDIFSRRSGKDMKRSIELWSAQRVGGA